MKPNNCIFFKESPQAPWICQRWITPDNASMAITQLEPFCAADFECEGKGRLDSPDAQLIASVAAEDRGVED